MIYNLKYTSDQIKSRDNLEAHIKKGSNLKQEVVPLKRSNDANSLYWLWLHLMEDETGEVKEKFHKYYKAKFIGTTEEEIFGMLVTLEPTTTDKNRKQFWLYMNKVKADAATEFGIRLPLPKDQGFQEFYEKYGEYS